MKGEGERGVLRAKPSGIQSGIVVVPTRRVGVLACLAGCSLLALLSVDVAAKARHGQDATKSTAKSSTDKPAADKAKSSAAKSSAAKPSAAKSSGAKSSAAKPSAAKSSTDKPSKTKA